MCPKQAARQTRYDTVGGLPWVLNRSDFERLLSREDLGLEVLEFTQITNGKPAKQKIIDGDRGLLTVRWSSPHFYPSFLPEDGILQIPMEMDGKAFDVAVFIDDFKSEQDKVEENGEHIRFYRQQADVYYVGPV